MDSGMPDTYTHEFGVCAADGTHHRPDNCDGTYEQFCDSSREYSNITAILQEQGRDDLLSYMKTYWPDYQGDDESFWEHEWNKHGTHYPCGCDTVLRGGTR